MGKKIIAADIGASSGKMAIASFGGDKLALEEYKDFPNRPAEIGPALYWDVFSLYHSILDGLAGFHAKYGEADTLGIDTWGASYGFLDREGRLLEPVYHYRDRRTDTVMKRMAEIMSPEELFERTGCQCNRTYTLSQLYSYRESGNPILDLADRLLFLPDLLGYFLTGISTTEMTIAGTSCLLDKTLSNWDKTVAKRFSIPEKIFTELVSPGSIKGPLRKGIPGCTGSGNIKLAAAAGHDSASAVTAIPGFDEESLYISVGTAISMGVERRKCLIDKKAFSWGMKNTGGFGGKKIIYRDFYAGWHINEFQRTRREKGLEYAHPELIAMAETASAKVSWFDVEDAALNTAGGDFCEKMDAFFIWTGQKIPENDSERIRSIFESIVLKAAWYAGRFMERYPCKKIFAVSGGSRNGFLMQLLSNALGRPLLAGMPYASLAGNLLTQLYAANEVSSLAEMREVSGRSFLLKEYHPEDETVWTEKNRAFSELLKDENSFCENHHTVSK